MGDDVGVQEFSSADRQRYRARVKQGLETLRLMHAEQRFESGRDLMGLEMEFYLVDAGGSPTMMNDKVLAHLESADFQTELAQFNIEFNLAPHALAGRVFGDLEDELRTSLNHALRRAQELDAHIMMIGILPTLTDLHITTQNMSRNPRYALLNQQILTARGEDFLIEVDGVEKLSTRVPSIMLEAAATSMQLHLQVDAERFARLWNAAQAIAAVQIAVGANSPFCLGKQLHAETRIDVLAQAFDWRTEELVAQGVRPRVWFGERWIESAVDLFDENVRYFGFVLPVCSDDDDPLEVLGRGDVPHLRELRLHNGTVYRWNRPVYDVARGKPHLRIENRVLPAGPTVVDGLANAALWYGLVRALAEQAPPVERRLSFSAAEANFNAAARDGIDAQLYWPGVGTVPASELVLRQLLPLAASGLDAFGIDADDRDRLLGIIEQRCLRHRNGASWQVDTFRRLYEHEGFDRDEALMEMTTRYADHMHSNEPVHTWS